MAHAESDILNRWLLRWNKWGRFFRAQVGRYWAGQPLKQWTEGGIKYVTLKNAYPIKSGVVGQPDYQGWHSMLIEPRHVGMCVAVYTVVEGKTPTGRVTDDQANFLRIVREAGGIAIVVRSPDDAPPEM